MSPRLLLLAMAAAGLAVAGCEDSHVSLERQRIALGKEFAGLITSSENLNQMLDKATQIDALAQRLEQLAERRKKLPQATAAQQEQLDKLRKAEAEEIKDKLTAHMQKMTPNALSGGLPDFSKMQKFQSAAMRLGKANVAYAPERFAGGAGGLFSGESFAPPGMEFPSGGTAPLPAAPGGLIPSRPQ